MSALTPQEIFEERIAEGLRKNPDEAKRINAVFQFKISGPDGGDWVVDLTVPEVREEVATDAQCTVTMRDKDFVDMVEGTLAPTQAFMTGKLGVDGDIGLAMKLQAIFNLQG